MNISSIGFSSPIAHRNVLSVDKRFAVPFIKSTPADSVSFTGVKKVPVTKDVEQVKKAADSLSTSTSGHRAIYGSELFDAELMKLFSVGVAQYAQEHAAENGRKQPVVMLGGDTRVATRESFPVIQEALQKAGVTVLKVEEPVATPILAAMAEELSDKVDITILMTASHNPWEYGGFNMLTPDGAVAPSEITQKVAANVKNVAEKGFYYERTADEIKPVIQIDPFENYAQLLESLDLIDFDNIKDSGVKIFYDSLGGTGDYSFPKLMDKHGIEISQLPNADRDLEGPEPNEKNLSYLSKMVKLDDSELKIGLANDGDADRFGVIDADGRYITPNEVIFLTAYHLHKNKGLEGPIVRSQVTTSLLDAYADKHDIPTLVTPVGFKFLADEIINARNNGGDILVAGEESGGLTVPGHIPEKDGIVAVLLMADLMAQEKKPLGQILDDIKLESDLHFDSYGTSKKLESDADKAAIMSKMEKVLDDAVSGKNVEFLPGFFIDVDKSVSHRNRMIEYKGNSDGVKLFFTNGSQLTVRKSGTEPKVRVSIDSMGKSDQEAQANCSALKESIDDILAV
ncbi:MAG: hypothetical protein E7Z90_05600 [Cyanobacteria bacterium SIG29]|nr:hypothetical protein [Cyanobacteria bacterium SIG29]